MAVKRVLIVGGGIAGLTSAIALRRKGVDVDVVEIDPTWSVYGVGIIQQANVVRAMAQLGLIDEYLSVSFGFDDVKLFDIAGRELATIPTPRLAGADYPSSLGVSRRALHSVLGDNAIKLGASVRLGVSVERFQSLDDRVEATFNDGAHASYDVMIGADGIFSKTRAAMMPDVQPRYIGQAVWRYNFPRDPAVTCLCSTASPEGNAGLVPLSESLMYLYVTTEEPDNPRFEPAQLADLMRARMAVFGGRVGALRERIIHADEVVYKPILTVHAPAPWHRGRVMLIGDAAHATSPHLGQGAGMAIEDSVVLSEELTKPQSVAEAFDAFMRRRYERCRFIAESSETIARAEIEKTNIDRPAMVRRMLEVTAEPI